MQDHRFVSKINQWLWNTEGQWPQPSAKSSNENKCLHPETEILLLSCYLKQRNSAKFFPKLSKDKIQNTISCSSFLDIYPGWQKEACRSKELNMDILHRKQR